VLASCRLDQLYANSRTLCLIFRKPAACVPEFGRPQRRHRQSIDRSTGASAGELPHGCPWDWPCACRPATLAGGRTLICGFVVAVLAQLAQGAFDGAGQGRAGQRPLAGRSAPSGARQLRASGLGYFDRGYGATPWRPGYARRRQAAGYHRFNPAAVVWAAPAFFNPPLSRRSAAPS
jgi:hypothetical protein